MKKELDQMMMTIINIIDDDDNDDDTNPRDNPLKEELDQIFFRLGG